jgi:hypothetical protein
VKFLPIINYEDGGADEPCLFQAIKQLLQKGCGALQGFDDCWGMAIAFQEGREESVSLPGSVCGLGFFEELFGLDCSVLDGRRIGPVEGAELLDAEGRKGFVGSAQLGEGSVLLFGFLFYKLSEVGLRGGSSDCFDPTSSGGDGFLASDFEEPDLCGVADVGTPTQFHRVAVQGLGLAPDLNYPYFVSVLVPEELHDVLTALNFVEGNLLPAHGLAGLNAAVDLFLEGGDLFRAHGAGGEIKPQAILSHQRPLLGCLWRNNLMQGPV